MLVSTAVTRAYREASIRPIGSTPTPEEMEEGLYRLNALWRGVRAAELGDVIKDWQYPNKLRTAPHNSNNINQNFPGNLDGFNQPGVSWSESDETGDGLNHRQAYPPINCRILCATKSTGHTIYFPQFPYDGARMAIVSVGMTDPITIEANGRLIEGNTSVVFDPSDLPREWLYRADIASWHAIHADLTETDDTPLPSEFDDFFVCGLAIRLCALDEIDPRGGTVEAYTRNLKKIRERYYQPGIMSYGGQNLPNTMQSYNDYWGYGTNFRSGT